MVRMKHKLTGTEMWVADARMNEYLAAGHKLYDEDGTPEKAPEKPKAGKKKK